MEKYILIEVANREINHLVYDNLDNAKAALYALYEEARDNNGIDPLNINKCWISEDNDAACISEWDCQYDWAIISV